MLQGRLTCSNKYSSIHVPGLGVDFTRSYSTSVSAMTATLCVWVKRNDRADRLAGKATLTSTLLLGRSEVLRSLRHYPRSQNQRHHTTDRLEERGVERGSARRSSLKADERGPSSIRRTLEPFQGDFERQGGAHMGFSEHIDTILNWTEQQL